MPNIDAWEHQVKVVKICQFHLLPTLRFLKPYILCISDMKMLVKVGEYYHKEMEMHWPNSMAASVLSTGRVKLCLPTILRIEESISDF